MRILVIDNYDSFTYNLVQYLGELGVEPEVVRNDAIDVGDRAFDCDGLLISPGPGRPENAGVSLAALAQYGGERPVLGVCLGHQCLAQQFGARIVRAQRIMHGKVSRVLHDGKGVFQDLPNPFEATRYHSLVVDADSVPAVLEVCARTTDGDIMGIRHRRLPLYGVQFHPESILTQHGHRLLQNFLSACREAER